MMATRPAQDPKVGDFVVYHNTDGEPQNGLVTAVWGPTTINITVISIDKNKQDNYGRQTERFSSCQHKILLNGVKGNYWRFPDEEPNAGIVPQEV